MPVAIAEFVEQLTLNGILTEKDRDQCLEEVESTGVNSVEAVAKQLIKSGKVTKLQAQMAYSGKAESLVMGSYVILDKLGEGGMGQVFKARHQRMKREVALKVLAPRFVKDDTALRRFHREVEAAARLTHANIVTAFDADEARGTHYLVMEYVRGQDLGAIVKKSGPLPVAQAVDCVLQAARGLAYAHEQGVVHRDIKPANLLLDDTGTVKILDMGLARFDEGVGADVSEAGLTGTGALMGTVDYMAPEQAMDSKSADHRADIYSLGCTLYFLITGKPVYQEDTIMKRIMAHQSSEPPELPVDDPQLRSLFVRMVAKQADDRLHPTSQLVAALEQWQKEHGSSNSSAHSTDRAEGRAAAGVADTTVGSTPHEATVVPPSKNAIADSSPISDLNLDVDPEPLLTARRRSGKSRHPRSRRPPSSPADSGGGVFANPRLFWGGAAGLAALVLLGVIIVKITRPDGTTVEIEVPDGSRIQIAEKAGDTTAEESSTSVSSARYALRFDGAESHVTVPTLQAGSLDEFTVEGWFIREGRSLPDKGETLASTFQHDDEAAKGWGLTIWHDHLTFGVGVDSTKWLSVPDTIHLNNRYADVKTKVPLTTTGSHHFAVTFHRGLQSLFLDGELQGRQQLPEWEKSGIPFSLGGLGTRSFLGLIDEVRISNRARYQTTFVPQPRLDADEDTLALYHFDEGSGTAARDSSGHGHDAEIIGAIWVSQPDLKLPDVRPDGSEQAPQFAWELPADAPMPAIAPFDSSQAAMYQETWAKYLGVPVEYENSLGMKFRLIPPGEFLMGSPPEEIQAALQSAGDVIWWRERVQSEGPQHKVILTQPIYVGKYEVTQSQYERVMLSNPSHFSASGQGQHQVADLRTAHHPAEMVAWYDAIDFCAKLSTKEDMQPHYLRSGESIEVLEETGYRLLSEAEWEFACRAGTTTRFSTGDDDSGLLQAGWIGSNSGLTTHAVGGLNANSFGLYDMHGNVWEWVEDRWAPNFYSTLGKSPAVNPSSSHTADLQRVFRGGGWDLDPTRCRSSHRHHNHPTTRSQLVGFRVALSLESVRSLLNQPGSIPPPTAPSEIVDGELAPLDQRVRPRPAGLPPYKNTLRPGQPLGEFAAVPAPAKLNGLISWSIEPLRHRVGVSSIDVSSDGTIATGGSDYAIRLWTPDWRLLKVLPGHRGAVVAAEFSPDGKTLASVCPGPGDYIAIWDVTSGQLLQTIDVTNWHGTVRWSPQGDRLAHCASGLLEIFDPFSGKKLAQSEPITYPPEVCWSPDGSRVAVASDRTRQGFILDSSTMKVIRTLSVPDGLHSLDWSGDGRWLAVGTDRETLLFDTRTFDIRHHLELRGLTVRFSPDSTQLAIGRENFLEVLDTKDWNVLSKGPHALELAWTSDGKRIHSNGGTLIVEEGTVLTAPLRSSTEHVAVTTKGNGTRLATATHEQLRVWDGKSGSLIKQFQIEGGPGDSIQWQPRGDYLMHTRMLAEDTDRQVSIIDSNTGREVHRPLGHPGSRCTGACWAPDGHRLATIGEDGVCRVWNADDGSPSLELTHDDPLWWVTWSSDGSKIACGSSFSAISVWDATEGKLLREFKTLSANLINPRGWNLRNGGSPFGFLQDSNRLMVMHDDGIEIADVQTGQVTPQGQLRVTDGGGGNRVLLRFAPDFKHVGIYTGYLELHLFLPGSPEGRSLRYFVTPEWLDDSRHLVGGDNHATYLRGYDIRTNRFLGTLLPNLSGDAWAILGPDGRCAGSDGHKEHLVVVAMLKDGSVNTYRLDEFAEHFGWDASGKLPAFLGK